MYTIIYGSKRSRK